MLTFRAALSGMASAERRRLNRNAGWLAAGLALGAIAGAIHPSRPHLGRLL